MPSAEQIVLDPPEDALGNVGLDLTDGINYQLVEHDYPTPDIDTSTVSSVDTEGDPVTGNRYRNRVLRAKFKVWGNGATPDARQADLAAALAKIEYKVNKCNKERRGSYRRTLKNGYVVYYDTRAARLTETHDQSFQTRQRCYVDLEFVARPFGRGTRVTLPERGPFTRHGVWVEENILGSVAGLGRLTIRNASVHAQKSVVWGMDSLTYSPDATAALYYEAEGLQDSTPTARTNASGGNVHATSNISTDWANPTTCLTLSNPGWQRFTHVGRYRMLARVWNDAGTDIYVALRYAPATYGKQIQNAWQQVKLAGAFQILDLGMVHIDRIPVGDHSWSGSLVAASFTAGRAIELDYVEFIPVIEGAGLSLATTTDALAATNGKLVVQHDCAWRNAGDVAPFNYTEPDKYEGFYLYVPPAGVENRKARFIVDMSRAWPTSVVGATNYNDTMLDELYTQLEYTPRYLVTPTSS